MDQGTLANGWDMSLGRAFLGTTLLFFLGNSDALRPDEFPNITRAMLQCRRAGSRQTPINLTGEVFGHLRAAATRLSLSPVRCCQLFLEAPMWAALIILAQVVGSS